MWPGEDFRQPIASPPYCHIIHHITRLCIQMAVAYGRLIQHLAQGMIVALTLTVLVATIDAQWEGMGDVGSSAPGHRRSTSRHYFPHARP